MPQEGDEGRVYNTISGYPEPAPGSSPAPGAEQAGAPPAPETEDSRHEPAPGSQRWNEVYRQAKDAERENESLRARLAEYESLEATLTGPQDTAPAEVAPPPQGEQFDPWEEIRGVVREAAKEAVAPVSQEFAEFKRQQAVLSVLEQFRQRHPEYVPERDDGELRPYLNQKVPLEHAWKLVQYDRGMASAPPPPTPQHAPPVADVPGGGPQTPASNVEALVEEFHKTSPDNIERRRWLASQISDQGYGSAEAEAALGL